MYDLLCTFVHARARARVCGYDNDKENDRQVNKCRLFLMKIPPNYQLDITQVSVLCHVHGLYIVICYTCHGLQDVDDLSVFSYTATFGPIVFPLSVTAGRRLAISIYD